MAEDTKVKLNDNNWAITYYRALPNLPNDISINLQRAAAQRYAAANGYRIVREYEDRFTPGLNVGTGLKHMLAELDEVLPAALIVWGTDRMSRRPFELAMAKRAIRDAGCQIHCLTEPDPGASSEVALMVALLDVMTEFRSKWVD